MPPLPKDDKDEVPPLADPRWKPWTRPLLALLARPRRWSRMVEWGRGFGASEGLLRQLAAALEEMHEAESVRHGQGVVWRRKADRARDWAAPSPA